MKTRNQYMETLPKYGTKESTEAHNDYYSQFVTPYVLELVKSRIGVDKISASKDEHFNDIPLSSWDAIWLRHEGRRMFIVPPPSVSALLKEAGEGNSASTGTCILKQAARIIKSTLPVA
jgi:hypothetical protein